MNAEEKNYATLRRLSECIRGVEFEKSSEDELKRTDRVWTMFYDKAFQRVSAELRAGNVVFIKRDLNKQPPEVIVTFGK